MMRAPRLALALLLLAPAALAGGLLRSGPQVGERPLPFTSNIVSGPHRGKQFCYVCELKDEPAVLVFARRTDENTARLMRSLRDAVREHQAKKLFAWFVFLGPEDTVAEAALEKQAYEFARRNGTTTMPVSALGEPLGPPGYLISPEADVTVLLFRSGKVRANRAYRQKDWNSRAVDQVLKEIPALVEAPPAPG
jgi:hypothetical protein